MNAHVSLKNKNKEYYQYSQIFYCDITIVKLFNIVMEEGIEL
jgi:hypothetical protein